MRAVYIYGANADVPGYGRYLDMACAMLRSLRDHSSVDGVYCCWDGLEAEAATALDAAWPGIQVATPTELEIPRLGHYAERRLWGMRDLPVPDGTDVLRLECDLLFRGDPFDAFDWEFDVGFTQRAYWFGGRPVNMGLVAFRWSPRTHAFLKQWCAELLNPKLAEMRRFEQASQAQGCGWTREEMYPWSVLQHRMGNIQIAVLPSEFNWFPHMEVQKEAEVACRVFKAKWASPGKVRVFHFKGPDKSVMREIVEEAPCQTSADVKSASSLDWVPVGVAPGP